VSLIQRSARLLRVLMLALTASLAVTVAAPTVARAEPSEQETQPRGLPTGKTPVVIRGPVAFDGSGDITVAGYIIAPAGAFRPSDLHLGDIVIITGVLLPDGQTVRAESLEVF
jgi:hypothetical protein